MVKFVSFDAQPVIQISNWLAILNGARVLGLGGAAGVRRRPGAKCYIVVKVAFRTIGPSGQKI